MWHITVAQFNVHVEMQPWNVLMCPSAPTLGGCQCRSRIDHSGPEGSTHLTLINAQRLHTAISTDAGVATIVWCRRVTRRHLLDRNQRWWRCPTVWTEIRESPPQRPVSNNFIKFQTTTSWCNPIRSSLNPSHQMVRCDVTTKHGNVCGRGLITKQSCAVALVWYSSRLTRSVAWDGLRVLRPPIQPRVPTIVASTRLIDKGIAIPYPWVTNWCFTQQLHFSLSDRWGFTHNANLERRKIWLRASSAKRGESDIVVTNSCFGGNNNSRQFYSNNSS